MKERFFATLRMTTSISCHSERSEESLIDLFGFHCDLLNVHRNPKRRFYLLASKGGFASGLRQTQDPQLILWDLSDISVLLRDI